MTTASLAGSVALAVAVGLAAPPQHEVRRIAVLIGIQNFAGGYGVLSSPYADVEGLASALEDSGSYRSEDVLVLTDRQGPLTRAIVLAAVRNILVQDPGGIYSVLVHVSSHGHTTVNPVTTEQDSLIIMSDTPLLRPGQNEEHVAEKSLFLDDLLGTIESMGVKTVIALLDICRDVTSREVIEQAPELQVGAGSDHESRMRYLIRSTSPGARASEPLGPEPSIFSGCAAEALRYPCPRGGASYCADLDHDRSVLVREAYAWIAACMRRASQRPGQVPEWNENSLGDLRVVTLLGPPDPKASLLILDGDQAQACIEGQSGRCKPVHDRIVPLQDPDQRVCYASSRGGRRACRPIEAVPGEAVFASELVAKPRLRIGFTTSKRWDADQLPRDWFGGRLNHTLWGGDSFLGAIGRWYSFVELEGALTYSFLPNGEHGYRVHRVAPRLELVFRFLRQPQTRRLARFEANASLFLGPGLLAQQSEASQDLLAVVPAGRRKLGWGWDAHAGMLLDLNITLGDLVGVGATVEVAGGGVYEHHQWSKSRLVTYGLLLQFET